MALFLILVAIGASAGVAVAVAVGAARRREQTLATFAALARRHGLTLQQPQRMSGTFGGGHLEVVLATEDRSSGDSHQSVDVTQYRLRHPVGLRMGLKVTQQRPFLGGIADALGLAKDIKVGRPDLDDVVRIDAFDPAHASAVLREEPVVQTLIVARDLERFVITDESAFAQHDGWVGDAARFERFAGPLGRAVEALAASRARHRADWEADVDRAWGSLADAEGFHYSREHTALRASTAAGTVELAVVVGPSLATHAHIDVPSDHGIQMTRAGAMTAVSKLFGMQDIRIGVPVLDDQYVIQSKNEEAARTTLLAVSGDLLKLHESFGALTIYGGVLRVTRPELMLDRVEITALLRAMMRVADALAGQRAQPQAAFR